MAVPRLRLPCDVDSEEADSGDAERVVGVIELLVLEPAEAELVDHVVGRNRGPGEAAVLRSHRRVHVVADAVAVVQHGLGLQPVRRNPAQQVQAGAEGMPLGGTPVELAEAQVLVRGAVQGLELAIRKLAGGIALRRRVRGAGAR